MEDRKFGRYRMVRELARGGMATVYLAHDPRFNREVAIKVLPRQFLHDPQFLARFQHEAETVASLEHQGIVPVYDFGEQEDLPYLVMRYMAGGSLTDRIKKGHVSTEEAVAILRPIASALDYAHSKGVVHRDVKPSNILFDKSGDAYLSDFGIVRLAEATVSFTGSAVIGTAAYMSPEQAQGGAELDGRSDVYSLGVVLYEMLAGDVPYKGETPTQQLIAHILEPVPRISQVNADVSPEVETVLMRALAKNRDDRYPTAGALVDALEAAASGTAEDLAHPAAVAKVGEQPTPAAATMVPSTEHPATELHDLTYEPLPPAEGRRRLSGAVIAGVGAILLLLLGGGVVLAMQIGIGSSDPTPTVAATQLPDGTPDVTSLSPGDTAAPSSTPDDTPLPPTDTPTSGPPTDTAAPNDTPTLTPTETPSSTPTKTSTPTATPCVFGVQLVEVRNPFNWWYVNSQPKFDLVLRNTGACPWPDDTRLALTSQNDLGWPSSWNVGAVPVGSTKEINIQIQAPSRPNTLNIVWQLEGDAGQILGSEIRYDLRVEYPPTDTPTPTPTDTPTPTPTKTVPPTHTPVRNSFLTVIVYWDRDDDGLRDSSDFILSAVLELYAGTSCKGTVYDATPRAFLGYKFVDLPAGDYCVKVINKSVEDVGTCALKPRFGENTKVYRLLKNKGVEDLDLGFPYVCR
jgi:serine/threonine protein kinase